jgi:hypothetical protein
MREIGPELTGRTEYVPHRALTLIDMLYRDRDPEKRLSDAKFHAGRDLRRLWIVRLGHSEGVGGYGDGSRATDLPKADRAGLAQTGFRIQNDGSVTFKAGKRRGRTNERHLEDALFAALGLHDQEGNKVHATELEIALLIGAVDQADPPLTLTGITLALSRRYKETSKQAPPWGMGFLDVTLGRLAKHFGYMR